MPQNQSELDIWWSAYLATLAGGKAPMQAQRAAQESLLHYREAQEYAGAMLED